MRVPTHLAACLAALLFVSCGEVATCDCVPATFHALLKGRVTDPAGQPVQGARVRAEMGIPDCRGGIVPFEEGQTGADGRYRVEITSYGPADRGECLRAFAVPPSGSALAGSDTVPFAVEFGMNEVGDSARVDFVLRAP